MNKKTRCEMNKESCLIRRLPWRHFQLEDFFPRSTTLLFFFILLYIPFFLGSRCRFHFLFLVFFLESKKKMWECRCGSFVASQMTGAHWSRIKAIWLYALSLSRSSYTHTDSMYSKGTHKKRGLPPTGYTVMMIFLLSSWLGRGRRCSVRVASSHCHTTV